MGVARNVGFTCAPGWFAFGRGTGWAPILQSEIRGKGAEGTRGPGYLCNKAEILQKLLLF